MTSQALHRVQEQGTLKRLSDLEEEERVRGLTRLAAGTSRGNQDRGTGRRVGMYISGEDSGCSNKP